LRGAGPERPKRSEHFRAAPSSRPELRAGPDPTCARLGTCGPRPIFEALPPTAGSRFGGGGLGPQSAVLHTTWAIALRGVSKKYVGPPRQSTSKHLRLNPKLAVANGHLGGAGMPGARAVSRTRLVGSKKGLSSSPATRIFWEWVGGRVVRRDGREPLRSMPLLGRVIHRSSPIGACASLPWGWPCKRKVSSPLAPQHLMKPFQLKARPRRRLSEPWAGLEEEIGGALAGAEQRLPDGGFTCSRNFALAHGPLADALAEPKLPETKTWRPSRNGDRR